jgi:hypothetical protein
MNKLTDLLLTISLVALMLLPVVLTLLRPE